MSGDTQLKAISLKPGIMKDTTEYMAEGGFVDCDLIRWHRGKAEKIGGWVRETVEQEEDYKGGFTTGFSTGFDQVSRNSLFTGVARDIQAWSALDAKKYLLVASHLKLEMYNDGIIYDVTPIDESVTLEDKLSTTSGSSIVTITDITHNRAEGDIIYVTLQDTAVDGVTLTGEYTVYGVTDADNFTVDSGQTASGTTALAGDTLTIDYLLSSGYQSNGNNTGWGGGVWGDGTWDTPRAGVGGTYLRQWSLDTWGEDALACNRRGKIYTWDATSGPTTRFTEITQAPDTNLFILVSQPSRHLIAFGSEVFATSTFDPLIIRWAEQETLTGWTITATNTAGEYKLPKGNYIVGAIQTRSEILVFTDTDVYSMRYIGGDDIFQIQPLGTNTSVLSQNAAIDVNGIVYWMGLDGFYIYDGVISGLPCTVSRYMFEQDGEGRINFDQKEKAYCGLNKEFNEIWWFYPVDGEEENSNYVKYNYAEDLWDFGVLSRTVWIDKGTFSKPYALNSLGRLYTHEIGKDNDGTAIESFIKTAYFDIDDGQNFVFVDKIIPDLRLATNKNIAITVYTKRYPHPEADVVTKGPYYFDDSDLKISLRARGRQMALEFRSIATGGDFELGKIRLGFQSDGER